MQLFEYQGQCHLQYINDIPERSGTLRPDFSIFRAQPARSRLRDMLGGVLGEANGLHARHSAVDAPGRPAPRRGTASRRLCEHGHGAGMIEQTRSTTNGGLVLGSEELVRGLSARDDRRTWPGELVQPTRAALPEDR